MKRTVKPAPLTYELGEILGQGANGTVFKARRRDSSRQIHQTVAVKILNSRKSVGIWRREFESLAAVHSRHCVRVFGFEWLDGSPALILEFVDGISLADLARPAVLDRREIECLSVQIHEGLNDLAGHGLCHGDLSPGNVLIDRDGRVRLVDFGFGNTATGRRQVTVEFAAPEVLAGGAPGVASDLWSLGRLIGYLGGEPSLSASLLREDPPKRRFAGVAGAGGPRARRLLGARVRRILDQRQTGTPRTRPLAACRGSYRRWIAGALLAVSAAGVGSSEGSAVPRGGSAQVLIRSQFGVEIEWQKRPAGYAPLDLVDLAPGTYELRWRSGNREGRRSLTLRPGDSIVLDDQTFANPGR